MASNIVRRIINGLKVKHIPKIIQISHYEVVMKTSFLKLKLFNFNKVILYILMNLLLFCLLFFPVKEKELIYLFLVIVFIIYLLTFWYLFLFIKQVPKTDDSLISIIFFIGLLLFSIILSYANLYQLIFELRGKIAFKGTSLKANDFLYYSITTFTTTGYGDITSIGPISNLIAASEMLIGYAINTTILGIIATKIYQTEISKKGKSD
ncbi:potassium channel family protein [Bacillus sp. USDA818B3_A]|uniref:potassium channel family protein n=1 Tax=Bacillus sp. USDA818B3_A TaxID=2698834 RepID=UPI00136A56D0|nr:potassium channel family protein [Bacillus sp. USDA818B3_A]